MRGNLKPVLSARRRSRRVAQCRSIRVPETCQQDRPVLANVDSPFDGAAYGRREGHEHDLAALPAHPQHTVTVLLTQVVDVAAGGLKDAQPEKAQHGD